MQRLLERLFDEPGKLVQSMYFQGNTATWTASAGAWAGKPVSDLRWSLTPTGASTAMSQISSTLLSGSAGAGTPTTVYMRPVVNWTTDKPGVYTMGVTFTLTTP